MSPFLRRIATVVGVAAVAGCGLAAYLVFGYDSAFVVGAIRYKLSMTFDVDGRTVTASTIEETGFQEYPAWMLVQQTRVSKVRGYALAADLGELGSVVATVDAGDRLPSACGTGPEYDEPVAVGVARLRKALHDCELNLADNAKSLMFLRGPSFGQALPPLEKPKQTYESPNAPPGFLFAYYGNDLTAAFGGRVKLRRVWFEPTDEEMSPTSLAQVRWARPIIDGTVPAMLVPSFGAGGMTVTRYQLAREHFNR